MITDKEDIKRKMLKTNNSIIFDRFEQEIKYHPVIIFSDDYGNLYYIKSRSAKDDLGKYKEKINNEILITKYEKGLPSKDSYVDLTQIFKISEEDFYKVFNRENVIFLNSVHLKHEDVIKIYNGLYENLSQEPPKVSMSFVYEDNNGRFKSYLMFSDPQLLINDLNKKNLPPEKYQKYKEYISDVIKYRNADNDFLIEIRDVKNGVREEFEYYIMSLRNELKTKSLVFNEFEEKTEYECLILCNSNNEKYYLPMRDKLDFWGKKWILNENNILVTMYKNSKNKQKYIDTSNILKITNKDFEKFNKNKIVYLSSDHFNNEDITEIVKMVNKNIKNNFNISFLEVTKSEDKNELEAKNLYSSKEKLKLAFEEKIWYDEQMYKDFSKEVLVNRNHQNLDKIKEFKEIFKNWYKDYLKENKQSNSNAYTI
ncbi:Mbov_0400 family ICE element protein [Mycoplasmopsis cynos]|uniref:Mbov_0400 family ICE element protein n=1 Tax=Mycoplasmopsis cynos TaxID=171284 RepID=UPI002AFE2313|nr:hypothetical protein [Mycoplasmopsis cynos]WQQ12918.1 hypothetical protein RRG58_03005 [Mycoplasmopsis cynos]WQQ14566.1 hypothetical protein RRG42_03080 [Mycoplasmopsis cynos]WQQ16424.1 hypothetical protein RRG51_01490 [Mycoplasmopsis cynos]WQQ17505.1 hypothetical protein RRG56_03015 [Mycoplasmopsis cynos]